MSGRFLHMHDWRFGPGTLLQRVLLRPPSMDIFGRHGSACPDVRAARAAEPHGRVGFGTEFLAKFGLRA